MAKFLPGEKLLILTVIRGWSFTFGFFNLPVAEETQKRAFYGSGQPGRKLNTSLGRLRKDGGHVPQQITEIDSDPTGQGQEDIEPHFRSVN